MSSIALPPSTGGGCSAGHRGSGWNRGAGGRGGRLQGPARRRASCWVTARAAPPARRGSDDCAVPRATKFESAGRARLRPAPLGAARRSSVLVSGGHRVHFSPRGRIRLGGPGVRSGLAARAGRALGCWRWGCRRGTERRRSGPVWRPWGCCFALGLPGSDS